jgi:hypothetical protein
MIISHGNEIISLIKCEKRGDFGGVKNLGVRVFLSSACVRAYFLSLLIFLVSACRRTSKSQKLQKALTSGLIINVKYRSIRVMIAGIESA